MPDNLKPEDRKKTMKAVKGKGTKLERRLSAMLAGMRIKGWRKNANDVSGKPDIVFDVQKIAIFIDGCFWHGCPICQRKLPETNKSYWERKINRNIELAREYKQILEENGWQVIRIWEHEIKKTSDREKVRKEIRQSLLGDQTHE
jgi:DNA mismatch endonuclease (patch repair protein)